MIFKQPPRQTPSFKYLCHIIDRVIYLVCVLPQKYLRSSQYPVNIKYLSFSFFKKNINMVLRTNLWQHF